MATATTALKSKHKGPTQTVVTNKEGLSNPYGEGKNKVTLCCVFPSCLIDAGSATSAR